MIKLQPTRQKVPFSRLLIYLLLALAVILVLISWNRISLFIHTLFQFSN
jgi:hypothetical protein